MKRLIVFLAAAVFCGVCFCEAAFGFDELPAVYVDCEEVEFPIEGEIVDGEVYVPIRSVLEKYLNREIYFVDTSKGKLLIAETYDGRFMLNLNNGAYAYIISNYSYGVVSLYDNTGEDKMGVLEHKPYIKDGYTMLPVKEVLEILDGEVNYDEEFGQISVVSDTYRENVKYVGEPFPLVMAFGDMDIYQTAKLADCSGYEEFAERCLEFYGYDVDLSIYEETEEEEEEDEWGDWYDYYESDYYYDYYSYSDERDEIIIELFGYLRDLSDSDLMTGDIKEFLVGDFSSVIEIDDELEEEESILSIARYLLDELSGVEGEGVIRVNSEHEEAARLCVMVVDALLELAQLDYYSISEELYEEIEERGEAFSMIFSYIEAVYDDEFWDSLTDTVLELHDEYGEDLYSELYSTYYGYYNIFTENLSEKTKINLNFVNIG